MIKMYLSSSRKIEKKSEYGGYFTFENFLKPEYTLFSTCRAALEFLLNELDIKNKTVLIPGFTCHAVIQPFILNSFDVEPYGINNDFSINYDMLIESIKINQPGIVVIHDYFGFNTSKNVNKQEFAEALNNSGSILIEDMTQSMFSTYSHMDNCYYVGSIRKWCGIPDGGFLYPCQASLESVDDVFLKKRIKAMTSKGSFLENGEGVKQEFLDEYRNSEMVLDEGKRMYGISKLSNDILKCYNFDSMKKQRTKNYRILFANINNRKEFDKVLNFDTNKEVPFYFPLLVNEKRKDLQTFLAKNDIYATIIWTCPEEVSAKLDDTTRGLYDRILCVPCDQRYNEDDMLFISSKINEFYEKDI